FLPGFFRCSFCFSRRSFLWGGFLWSNFLRRSFFRCLLLDWLLFRGGLAGCRCGYGLLLSYGSDFRREGCLEFVEAKVGGSLPQPLDIVKLAFFPGKDVDDKVHIVEQDPFALAVAFNRVDARVEVALHAIFNRGSDGLVLSFVGPAADQKIIG